MHKRIVLIISSFIFLLACKQTNKQEMDFIQPDYASLYQIAKDKSELQIRLSTENYKQISIEKAKERIVCFSNTHISFLDAINREGAIVGIPAFSKLYGDDLLNSLQKVGTVEIGKPDAAIEKIIDLEADLIIQSHDSKLKAYHHIENYEIEQLPFLAHLEMHPLGRLEWIKCIGAVCGDLESATRYFDDVKEKYLIVKADASVSSKKVFVGYKWNSSWYVAGGNGYMAHYIEDAGGQFLLADDEHTGNFPISEEHAFEYLSEADIWLHPGYMKTKLSHIDYYESLKDNLKPELVIYNNNQRMNPTGANDFWQSGYTRPDLVLRDLIYVLNDQVDSLFYYRKLN